MAGTAPILTIDEFRELVRDIDVVMLTTVGADGRLGCRPMAPRPLDALQPIQMWFLTRADTGAARQVAERSMACITYQSDERNLYVVVRGRAEELQDPLRVRGLWKPLDAVHFPEGPDSDALRLIRVFPEDAVVWQGPGGLVGKAVAMAQALVTGDAGALGQRSDVRL